MGRELVGDLRPVKCPSCGGGKVWRNGFGRGAERKKQAYRCKGCRRSFVVDPGAVPRLVKEFVDRMIGEEIPVPVIARVVDGYASRRWVYLRRRHQGSDVIQEG